MLFENTEKGKVPKNCKYATDQRTLTVGESITVQLVSSFTRLHWTASLNTNKIIFPSLISSSLVKLETNHTVILPPTVSVLWMVLTALAQDF